MTIASVKERGGPIMFGLNSSTPPVDPWPLRFKWHNFDAYCYNTLQCSVIYNEFQFSLKVLEPSGPPTLADYRSHWNATNIIGDEYAEPIKADWISLSGAELHAKIDLAEIFHDRLVRHNVAQKDIPDGWLAAWGIEPLGVDILMELNDRTVSVFMRAHIATKEPQIPGNPRSCHRRDLVEVWTRTY
jgi:hypothetical protein